MKRKPKTPVHKDMPTPSGIVWGYARVSTDDQDLTMQIRELVKAGVAEENIFTDKRSGKDLKRGGLLDVMSLVRKGDAIIVWRFDRLSRSLRDLLKVFDDLSEQGVYLKSIHEQLDTTTPMGKLMFQLAGMLAEFERNLIAARTAQGMATAKERGRKFGPERLLSDGQLDKAIAWLKPRATERGAVQKLAKRLKVSPYTLRNRVIEKTGKRLWPKGPRAVD